MNPKVANGLEKHSTAPSEPLELHIPGARIGASARAGFSPGDPRGNGEAVDPLYKLYTGSRAVTGLFVEPNASSLARVLDLLAPRHKGIEFVRQTPAAQRWVRVR